MAEPSKSALLRKFLLPVVAALLAADVLAAEVPAAANEIQMSLAYGQRLNAVIQLMDAGKLAEASAAMDELRATSPEANDYERMVTLQTAGTLHVAQQKFREAIADHEAILQLPTLSDADRLTSANLAGQLAMQVADWNKGLEHMLVANELQGGRNMETLFRIAFSHAQLGQVAAALPYMEQSLAAGGDQAGESYYMNMAVLYMQAEEHAKAISTYETILMRWPLSKDRELISSNLVALYIEVGNNNQARARLEALIRDFPDSERMDTWQQSLTALRTMP